MFSSGFTAFGDLLGAALHYHYGFGTVQLVVDRDGGSQSRLGFRQLSPTRLSLLPDGFSEIFMEHQSTELCS